MNAVAIVGRLLEADEDDPVAYVRTAVNVTPKDIMAELRKLGFRSGGGWLYGLPAGLRKDYVDSADNVDYWLTVDLHSAILANGDPAAKVRINLRRCDDINDIITEWRFSLINTVGVTRELDAAFTANSAKLAEQFWAIVRARGPKC